MGKRCGTDWQSSQRRHSQAGPEVSCKSTLLANDKSLGKLIVGHLICLGTSATDLGIATAAEKRRCAANQWKRTWKGRRRAKRVNRLCKMNSEAQKTHDDGHTPCSNLRPHRARARPPHRSMRCAITLKMGTVMGNTQACAHGSSAKSECHKLQHYLNH